MDKFILSNTEIQELFDWKDRNKDLVRKTNKPLKAIEVVLPDISMILKYIRVEDKITIYCTADKQGKFKYVLQVLSFGKYFVQSQPKHEYFGKQEFIHDIATLYFSLMALMVYGNENHYTEEELIYIEEHPEMFKITGGKSSRKKSNKKSVVYVLKRDGDNQLIYRPQGSHNSPKGIFSVRGHLRHLKSGKVVWIKEYKKGEGKHKNKTYKM